MQTSGQRRAYSGRSADMSNQTWDVERSATKGSRMTVKLWPVGPHKRAGMRYRMLRGEWHNTGHEGRDTYLSKLGLQERISKLEDSFVPDWHWRRYIAGRG